MKRSYLRLKLFHLTLLMGLCISLYGCSGISKGSASDSSVVPSSAAVSPVVSFSGCVGCDTAPAELLKTIRRYWEARRDVDFKAAFMLEAPHIQLQFHGVADYAKFFSQGMPVAGVQVLSIEKADGRLYEAKIKMESVTSNPAVRESEYVDRWVKVGREYRHVLRSLFGFIE